MKVVDLNVLLYAVNSSSAHHRAAKNWWEDALSGEETVGLTWIVLLGFLRLTTRRALFETPLTPGQALDRIQTWLDWPATRLVTEGEDHFRVLRTLLEEAGTAGNLTSDAHLAAIAIQHGATLVSFDADFGRFQGLRWKTPPAHR
jgi:toxin-antitoxin system PIN domain toxin